MSNAKISGEINTIFHKNALQYVHLIPMLTMFQISADDFRQTSVRHGFADEKESEPESKHSQQDGLRRFFLQDGLRKSDDIGRTSY